jgi:hypothetical protein
MFHFPDEVDWTRFFRFDKRWIENLNWARISPAAKAVLPVIACHCNERGESFPGEEVIAALSGRTAKIVRQGIRDLEGFPGFSCERYLTRRGKKGKRFNLVLPPKGERGRSFFFHRGIIDGGIWRKRSSEQDRAGLIPTAQALYPVMRYFSRYDTDENGNIEKLYDFSDHYANRSWELCDAEIGQLARFAGIDRRAVKDAMQSLHSNFLLEPHVDCSGEKTWKVYLLPKKYWQPSYLNQKLKDQAVS